MDTSSEIFKRDVLDASESLPIVVDFWAPWCAPCRVLGPVLERLAERAEGRWRLVKLNTEEHQHVALSYQVGSIPAVKLFRQGKVVADFVGALPEAQIQRWLDTHIPSAVQEDLSTARAAVKRGDRAAALPLLERIVAATPKEPEACALLANLVLTDDRDRAVQLVADIHEGDTAYEQADTVRTLARLLAMDPSQGDAAGWRATPAGLRYLEGIGALKAGDYSAAVDAFIAALRQSRKLDDDGARRACVALFRWLGDDHDVTRAFRRAFASALF